MELKFYGELSLSFGPSKTTFKEAHLSADLRSYFISAIFTSSLRCSYQNFVQQTCVLSLLVLQITYRLADFRYRCATPSAVNWLQCTCCSATSCCTAAIAIATCTCESHSRLLKMSSASVNFQALRSLTSWQPRHLCVATPKHLPRGNKALRL